MAIALLLTGSAISLVSCGQEDAPAEANNEAMLTELSDSLIMFESENGRLSLKFRTPAVEGYAYAKDPVRVFPRGIYVETYDSLGNIENTLTANYALEYTERKLWEAQGNVVATNKAGDILETPQLFWDQRSGKVYSNKDSKITRPDAVIYGEGFESDDKFEVWEFRKPKGQVAVDVEPKRDSTAAAQP